MDYRPLAFMLAVFTSSAMADSLDAQVSSFFIRDVSIDVKACRDAPRNEMAFACHRFEKGTGFGMLIRAYVPSSELETDTDAYYKTTFLFRTPPPIGRKLKLPNRNIFAFMSAGSSSFPERTGCYGEGTVGNIEVREKPGNILEVIYNIHFRMKSVNDRQDQCISSDLISRSFDTKRIEYKDLTAWLGLSASVNDAWNESHPEPHP